MLLQRLRGFLRLGEVGLARQRALGGFGRRAQIDRVVAAKLETVLLCQVLFEHVQHRGVLCRWSRLHLTQVVPLAVHAS